MTSPIHRVQLTREAVVTDEMLDHMCKLSCITVDLIRNEDNGITAPHVSDNDLGNMLSILADTFVELQRRQGIRPRFGRQPN